KALDVIQNKEREVVNKLYKEEANRISKLHNIEEKTVLDKLAPDSAIPQKSSEVRYVGGVKYVKDKGGWVKAK
ncbi:MAG: hypothetical protein H7831_14655, partial [Magnetococcus sp. WYHC-3]